MIRNIIIYFLFLISSISSLVAQKNTNYSRVLSYTQFLTEMLRTNKEDYLLENALIQKHKVENEYNPVLDSLLNIYGDTVKADITVRDCRFVFVGTNHPHRWCSDSAVRIQLRNLNFDGAFNFIGNTNICNLNFDACTFRKALSINFPTTINDITFINDLGIRRCLIDSALNLSASSIYINKSTINLKAFKFTRKGKLIKCNSVNEIAVSNTDEENPGKLRITESTITSDIENDNLKINGHINQITFQKLNASVDLKIEPKFLSSIEISQSTLHNFTFDRIAPFVDENKTFIPFHQFSGTLAIEDPQDLIQVMRDNKEYYCRLYVLYTGLNQADQQDKLKYNKLMASYNKFYHLYKAQGDLESTNAIYIAMQDVKTEHLKYIYNEHKDLENWFNWRLNQFLKTFCDYGAKPVKAIIFSMWTILCFAFFYFFFESNWDGINLLFLMKRYKKLNNYFRTKQTAQDYYDYKHIQHYLTYEQFQKEIKESRTEVPYFFHLLGKPLYYLSSWRLRFMKWYYNQYRIVEDRWLDLKPTKKILTGFKTFVVLLFYCIYLIAIRALNSIILSINAFSTLGFGNIPVKGPTRYFTIIQGFLGWFLLSLFSVSLISQIIQN